jgi:hypothetical protein
VSAEDTREPVSPRSGRKSRVRLALGCKERPVPGRPETLERFLHSLVRAASTPHTGGGGAARGATARRGGGALACA